ncbi:Rad51-domain-containing protein [Russula earlei]|uniref:Rad51-domain-containing protein n=1 Tax=Russula earlei TaxID=71964 RepID=A0ACC0UKP9_9AGAM|nr:Rad51-domain-containing protein [Russula earlei]
MARTTSSAAPPLPSRPESPVDEVDEAPFFDSVDDLQQHGINMQDILKLKAAAINTETDAKDQSGHMTGGHFGDHCLHNSGPRQGMSETKVEKIKGSSFATGLELQERRKRVLTISTGSKAVDAILGVYGEYRTGKTQLAHTMSVVAQLPPDLGGAAGKVAYIDTEGTFRPDRIRSIAERFGVNGDMALENILYARAFNSEHQVEVNSSCMLWGLTLSPQMELINECSQRFAEDKDFRLLIVDSIMALFRVDFSGRGELSERQQKVANFEVFHSSLYSLAPSQLAQVVILITNQVQSDPGATMTFVAGGALKPIGGHILSHASATRIFLRKGRAEERVAKLVDSPDKPESEASYKLDEGGWADV